MDIFPSEDNADVAKVYKKQIETEKADEQAYDQTFTRPERPLPSSAVNTTSLGSVESIDDIDVDDGLPGGANWAIIGLVLVGIALLLFFSMLFFVGREGSIAGFTAPGDNCSYIQCPAGPVGEQGVIVFHVVLFCIQVYSCFIIATWSCRT